MKKIVLLTGIIISTIVSCSTDDTQMDNNYNKKSSTTNFTTGANSDFCITCRDSIVRENDTTESEPIKPRRD